MDASALGVAAASYSASVSGGSTAITSATINGALGAGIVNGASLTVSVANDTGRAAAGSLDVRGNTVTVTATAAAAVGTALNGVTIVLGADGDEAAAATSWNAGTSTLTVTADRDNSNGTDPNDLAALQTAINTGLQAAGFGAGAVNLTQSAGFTAADFASAGSISITNGRVANAANTVVTITDDTPQEIISGRGLL